MSPTERARVHAIRLMAFSFGLGMAGALAAFLADWIRRRAGLAFLETVGDVLAYVSFGSVVLGVLGMSVGIVMVWGALASKLRGNDPCG